MAETPPAFPADVPHPVPSLWSPVSGKVPSGSERQPRYPWARVLPQVCLGKDAQPVHGQSSRCRPRVSGLHRVWDLLAFPSQSPSQQLSSAVCMSCCRFSSGD